MAALADLSMPNAEKCRFTNHQVAAFIIYAWCQCFSAKTAIQVLLVAISIADLVGYVRDLTVIPLR
jgi:hypothetical protein